MSRRQITPCVQVRRLVAATLCGDTSQWQIAVCVLENFCENLCLQQNFVAATSRKNQIRLNLCDLLWRQNFVAVTKIFAKILQYTPNDLTLQCVAATCCWNLSPIVYWPLWSMLTIYSCYIQFQFLLITALTYFHEIYQNDPPGNDLLSENDLPKPISNFWKWLPSKMAACPFKKTCISTHFKWKRKELSNEKEKGAQRSELVNKKILRSKYDGFYHLRVKLNCLQKESKMGRCCTYPTITEVKYHFFVSHAC